jgi:hypothetical protein
VVVVVVVVELWDDWPDPQPARSEAISSEKKGKMAGRLNILGLFRALCREQSPTATKQDKFPSTRRVRIEPYARTRSYATAATVVIGQKSEWKLPDP